MKYELSIAIRYFWATRKKFLNALLTLISVSGIAVGVMALIITISVMNGFQTDIKEKILSLNPHVVVYSLAGDEISGSVLKARGIKAFSKFAYGQMILRKNKTASGIVVKGIVPETEKNVISLERTLKNKDISLLKNKTAFIGSELAKNLSIRPGDSVILVSPFSDSAGFSSIPRMEAFTIADIFESGMYEYDSTIVYINYADAARFFGKDGIYGVEIRTNDIFTADKTAAEIKKELGYGYSVKSWSQMNRNLFSALKLEKFTMFLILTLIIIVATFNVISLLIVMTIEKIHSVGILKAVGAQPFSVTKIFIYLGAIIGAAGTFMGCVFGILACLILKKYHFIKLPADIYYIDRLPVQIVFSDVMLIIAVSLVITLVSAVYPAWKASRIDPCDAIRYE